MAVLPLLRLGMFWREVVVEDTETTVVEREEAVGLTTAWGCDILYPEMGEDFRK